MSINTTLRTNAVFLLTGLSLFFQPLEAITLKERWNRFALQWKKIKTIKQQTPTKESNLKALYPSIQQTIDDFKNNKPADLEATLLIMSKEWLNVLYSISKFMDYLEAKDYDRTLLIDHIKINKKNINELIKNTKEYTTNTLDHITIANENNTFDIYKKYLNNNNSKDYYASTSLRREIIALFKVLTVLLQYEKLKLYAFYKNLTTCTLPRNNNDSKL